MSKRITGFDKIVGYDDNATLIAVFIHKDISTVALT